MGQKQKYVPPTPTLNYRVIFQRSIITACFSALMVAVALFIFFEYEPKSDESSLAGNNTEHNLRRSNIVEMRYCEIPDFEIQDIKSIKLRRKSLPNCKQRNFLTSILSTPFIDDPLHFIIHTEHFNLYDVESVECCFHEISRIEGSDNEVNLTSECMPFEDQQELDKKIEQIYVKCFSDGEEVYSNAHAIIVRQKELIQRQEETEILKKNPFKVIMIGFDTVSRMNLQRGLPMIFNQINSTEGWFGMNGYTSISNESFPNLFAMLTGQAPDQSHPTRECDPTTKSFLDSCDFIWKDFKKSGYLTLFAEDQKNFSVFNKEHMGFKDQPADHYFRPFILAAENLLEVKTKDALAMCLGRSIYLDHIFIYLQKLMTIHEQDPFFAFAFINSLSDKQLSSSAVLDKRIAKQFLSHFLEASKNDTIFIIFSDSGVRFEDNESGFYEDRSPFLYFRLPPRFIEENPLLVENLKENSNRLTSPYDLHITLRHILRISAKKQLLLKSVGCPSCRSLFQEIPVCRRCHDAAIPIGSCPCSYQTIDVSDKKVVKFAAEFALENLNNKLEGMKTANGENCSILTLDTITDAHEQIVSQFNINYIIRFIVSPSKARFEATMRRKHSTLVSSTPQFEILHIVNMDENTEPNICVSELEDVERRFVKKDEDYVEDYDFEMQRSF